MDGCLNELGFPRYTALDSFRCFSAWTCGVRMNWYQSFSFFADGTWGYEFHCQSTDHPSLVMRSYWGGKNHGWLLKQVTTRWSVDNYHIGYL